MPIPTLGTQVHELNRLVAQMEVQITGLLAADRDRYAELEKLKSTLAILEKESARQLQMLNEQQERFRRWHDWMKVVVPTVLGLLTSLIVGLILLLLRKTS